jgi:hypothetical protein
VLIEALHVDSAELLDQHARGVAAEFYLGSERRARGTS